MNDNPIRAAVRLKYERDKLPTVEELLHRILAKYDDIPIRHLMAKDVDIIRHATLALEILEKDK